MAHAAARGRTSNAAARSAEELESLHAAALALSEQLDPEEVLERIVERAAALVEGSFGYVYVIDEAASDWSNVSRKDHSTARRNDDRSRRRSRRPRLPNRASQIENDYSNWPQRRRSLGTRCRRQSSAFPSCSNGRVVGVIGL